MGRALLSCASRGLAARTLHSALLVPSQKRKRGEGFRPLPRCRSEGDALRFRLHLRSMCELSPVAGRHLTSAGEELARQTAVPLVVVALQVAGHSLRHDVGRSGAVDAEHPPGAVAAEVGVRCVEADPVVLDGARGTPLLVGLETEEEDHRLGNGVGVAREKGGNLLLVHLITSKLADSLVMNGSNPPLLASPPLSLGP